LEGVEAKMVIADTIYDSDQNRQYCAQRAISVVIPARPNRLDPAPLDQEY